MPSECGCIPGHFLCPDAEVLWQASNAAYVRHKLGKGTWEDYKQARREYQVHIGKARAEEERCTQ